MVFFLLKLGRLEALLPNKMLLNNSLREIYVDKTVLKSAFIDNKIKYFFTVC